MKNYGIDIVGEWGDVHDHLKGIRYFEKEKEAVSWGFKHTNEDDGVWCGFMIFKKDTDEVVFHSFFGNNYPINRFELMDISGE